MLLWKRDPRRRQFFIKKEFQGKFILLFALCVIGPASLSVAVLYWQARQQLEKYLFSSHLKITHTGEIFSELMIKINLINATLIIVLVIFLSLYIFHRLNMHFLRMESRFDAMGQGDFSPLPQPQSRFNEVSNLINLGEQTRQNYRERYQNMEALLSRLEESLKNNASGTELSEHAKGLAEQLQGVSLPEVSTKEGSGDQDV